MGQGSNITISNFSSHILQIGVETKDNTAVSDGLDRALLQPGTGLRPVYIEGNNPGKLTLSVTVMRSDGRGGYEPDPDYGRSQACVELRGDHWSSGMQSSQAVLVRTHVQKAQQDLSTIFLHTKTVARRLRLYQPSTSNPGVWQGSPDGREWFPLWAPIARPSQSSTIPEYDLKIEDTTTDVLLSITNDTPQTFWLDVQGEHGSWAKQEVRPGGSWAINLPVTMSVGQRWEFDITPRSLPDPKFYITRKGGYSI